MNRYMQVFRKYSVLTGRTRRSEFWHFMRINIVVLTLLGIARMVFVSDLIDPIAIVFCLAILAPSVAAGVRRLHDTGRSGWFILLPLIPFTFLLGTIVLIVFWVDDSKPGDNKWGPNPKAEMAS